MRRSVMRVAQLTFVSTGLMGGTILAAPPVPDAIPLPKSAPRIKLSVARPADRGLAAGQVLSTSLAKTKSLQRTSQLLSVAANKSLVQIALVIDGTDSMASEIASLKAQLSAVVEGLAQTEVDQPPRKVEVAVVVYRDEDSPSGSVTMVVPSFTSDIAAVQSALESIEVERGLPYFQEKVDLGLHRALQDLNWAPASDSTAERWAILCGDAPPYPEDSEYRKFSDQQLGELAASKKIRTCAVLCGSGYMTPGEGSQRLMETAAEQRPYLENFAAALARQTQGTQVDTANVLSVDFWLNAQIEMPEVAEADLEKAREQLSEGPRGAEVVRVAVLPHMPLSQMVFGQPDRDEVVAARHLSESLKRIPGFGVKPINSVEAEFRLLAAQQSPQQLDTTTDQTKLLSALAKNLNVDYVVWGQWKKVYEGVSMETRIYRDSDGRQVAMAASDSGNENPDGQRDLAAVVLRRVCGKAASSLRNESSTEPEVLALFERVNTDDGLAKEIVSPLAKDHRAQRSLLLGLEYLERSLQSVVKVKQDKAEDNTVQVDENRDLRTSIAHLKSSLEYEPENALTQLLLANCYFNLAAAEPTSSEWPKLHAQYLSLAKENAGKLREGHPVRLEVEAEHALLVDKDFAKAIATYQQLLSDKSQRAGRFGLRARWMLAGIYLGDWNVASYSPSTMNVELARQEIINILAGWPGSPEARFYESCLHGGPVKAGRGLLAQSQ